MVRTDALDAAHVTTLGVVVIAVLVVLGVGLSLLITAVIGRVIILVVVVVLAIVVWQQRGHVRDRINKQTCDLHATFFGVHLDPPADVRRACANRN